MNCGLPSFRPSDRPGGLTGLFGTIAFLTTTVAYCSETAQVRFDIPDKIECRDVTPEKCAKAHPTLKVVEAKFRISANFVEGGEASVISFDYYISSPDSRFRILDYLPNTTLESHYDDDQIEVTDYTESSDVSTGEAKVGYSVFSLKGAKSTSSKKTEENRYRRIAPKSLVLASGTISRGHGVFYKLKPSNGMSLEGAKEFSFLAIVPKNWRADWCEFTCSARITKRTLVSTSTIVTAGIEHAHVGLFLLGETSASELCGQLCDLQQQDDGLLAKQFAKEASRKHDTTHTTIVIKQVSAVDDSFPNLLRLQGDSKAIERKLEHTRRRLRDVEERLERLSGAKLIDRE